MTEPGEDDYSAAKQPVAPHVDGNTVARSRVLPLIVIGAVLATLLTAVVGLLANLPTLYWWGILMCVVAVFLAVRGFVSRSRGPAVRTTAALITALAIGAVGLAIPAAHRDPQLTETWSYRVPTDDLGDSMVIGDRLYYGDSTTVRAIDTTSGEQLWELPGVSIIANVTPDGYLYLENDDQTKYSWVDPQGTVLWTVEKGPNAEWLNAPSGRADLSYDIPLAAADGVLVFGLRDGPTPRYVAIAPDGAVAWEAESSEQYPFFPVQNTTSLVRYFNGQQLASTLIVDNSAGYAGTLTAYDPATGEQIRTFDADFVEPTAGRTPIPGVVVGDDVVWQQISATQAPYKGPVCDMHRLNVRDGSEWTQTVKCLDAGVSFANGWLGYANDATLGVTPVVFINVATGERVTSDDLRLFVMLDRPGSPLAWGVRTDTEVTMVGFDGRQWWSQSLESLRNLRTVNFGSGVVAMLAAYQPDTVQAPWVTADYYQQMVTTYDPETGDELGRFVLPERGAIQMSENIIPVTSTSFLIADSDGVTLYELA